MLKVGSYLPFLYVIPQVFEFVEAQLAGAVTLQQH